MEFSHLLLLLLLLLPFFSTTSHSKPVYSRYADCAPTSYVCGDASFTVGYPFRVDGRRDYCGYPNFYLSCPSNDSSTLTITVSNKNLHVTSIDYDNRLLHLIDTAFVSQSCPQPYVNTTVDANLFRVSDRTVNLTLFINCTASSSSSIPAIYDMLCLLSVTGQHSYYRLDNGTMDDVLGGCRSTVVVPMAQDAATRMASGDLGFGAALQEGFSVNWLPGTGWCGGCVGSGGRCGFNSSAPGDHTCYCSNGTFIDSCYPTTPRSGKKGSGGWKFILGVLVLVLGLLLVCAFCLLCYRRRSKQRLHASTLLGPISSVSTPSPKKDIESMSFHCHTHLFPYQELEEATMGFDRSQEIGDGGYGSVYKGVLRDGRVVAVKRLYETNNNDKRVEQFVNEVEILSRVRHPNLVTLYGCTSPKSPHLLLVYEFVPNGTLADHLHDPLRSRSLPLSLRLSMAVDAASALFYLHSIDIIHRDVKTHNILVDQNYNVKIADFGLSRLFVADATHVSTLPQGTPGYLDPEYHRFYKLTDKSDVYSYGVVLMELLSSRPAVDVGRHPSEVSLGMMAVEKIPKGELGFVDPALTDSCNREADTAAAIARVAELAFRCLQEDREMRPSIKEVLEELRDVSRLLCSSGSAEADGELKLVRDDVSLLKESTPFSPNSVIDNWMSASTTLTASK